MTTTPVGVPTDEETTERPVVAGHALGAFTWTDTYFRTVLDALPVAVYITDAAGKIVYFNEAAVRLWGRRPDLGPSEWCGSWKLFWPDGRAMTHEECPMAIALREGRTVRGLDAIAERPDGTRVRFMPFPTPLYGDDGKLAGAMNLLVDITERTDAEVMAQRLAAIVESSNDAIVAKDLEGTIMSWNTGAERLFGYLAREVIGKPVTILIPEDRLEEETVILATIRRGEKVPAYETVRRRKDGTLVDVSLAISPSKTPKEELSARPK